MCLYLKNNSVECMGIILSFGMLNLTVFIPDYEITHVKKLNVKLF